VVVGPECSQFYLFSRGFARIGMVTKSRIIRTAATAAIALGFASAAYQSAGEARDRRRHPPPGRLVDVGGYRFHIKCVGHGTPPVVICPAIGATVGAWQDVQRRVSQDTTICVYDRAGLGHSDSPRRRRTATCMAEELHGLLHGAGLQPPYVLAGHSMGGLIVRVFASLYLGEVAGLALIDSSHPEQEKRLPRTHLRDYPGGMLLTVAHEWMRPLGLRRMARDLGLRSTADVDWSCHRRADSAELLQFRAISRVTAALAGELGDLPLAVITSAEFDPKNTPGSRQEHARSRFYAGWVPLQKELATLSTNSTHIVANHGGHHLNRDNPELVARVMADLVKRVRSAGR
jgi:pimeloyl-ACP methyl ester carboxylesterase